VKIATRCPACDGTHYKVTPAVLTPFVAERVFGWQTIYTERVIAYSICNTMRCLACGCVFCDIRFDPVEMRRLYAGYMGAEYTAMRDKYERGWKPPNNLNHAQAVEWFLSPYRLSFPVSILDWGGDTGRDTPFKDRCRKLDIYDIGTNSVQWGTRVDAPRPPYGLVVCSNVLEHDPYPAQILTEIHKAMDAATILYVEVPYNSPVMESKTYWHEHINFFTEASISRLLSRCGLEVITSQHLPPVYMLACKRKQ
jgi:hypothetical protein